VTWEEDKGTTTVYYIIYQSWQSQLEIGPDTEIDRVDMALTLYMISMMTVMWLKKATRDENYTIWPIYKCPGYDWDEFYYYYKDTMSDDTAAHNLLWPTLCNSTTWCFHKEIEQRKGYAVCVRHSIMQSRYNKEHQWVWLSQHKDIKDKSMTIEWGHGNLLFVWVDNCYQRKNKNPTEWPIYMCPGYAQCSK